MLASPSLVDLIAFIALKELLGGRGTDGVPKVHAIGPIRLY